MEYKIRKNGKDKLNGMWEPGDSISVELINKNKQRSIIELFDQDNNRRFFTHSGIDIINFKASIPMTSHSGVWILQITQSTENVNVPIEIIGLKDLKQQNKKYNSTVGKNNLDEINEIASPDSDSVLDKAEETAETINEEPEEEINIEPIDITTMSVKKIEIMISELDTESYLSRILEIELNKTQKIDLDIPIAEIESIDSKYYVKLKDRRISNLAQMLSIKPIEIKEIAEAPMSEIREWYVDLYRIYKRKNHRLKKEYRKIRAFNETRADELQKVRDSPKADDQIEVLSGVSDKAKEKLSEQGIVTVLHILEQPLDSLMGIEVDIDKPLLWKVWIANAKSHFGIH